MNKTVTFTLQPVSVNATGATQEELLENAKKELIKQLEGKFPSYSYSVNDTDSLTFDTVKIGLIVETKDGDKGIVTALNKKTINVTLTGGRNVQGAPQAFKKSDATFEEARSKRESSIGEDFYEGHSGYLKTNDGIKEVVLGKSSGAKYKLYPVNGEGGFYTLNIAQIKSFLKDTKEESEK